MSEPRISVVIAASATPAAALRALGTIERADDVECLVVAPADWFPRGGGGQARPPELAPGAAWVLAEPGSTVPRLRRLGLDRARGGVVVMTEDSCLFGPGWLDAWRSAFADPATLAAGGPVVAAMGDRAVDRAVFLCEYAPFGVGAGPPPGRLPGNNFALRRALAQGLGRGPVEEADVQRLAGTALAWSPGATAFHVRRYGLAEAIRDRLRFGYGYGRARMAGRRWPWRVAGLAAGPTILAAQACRLVLAVGSMRGDRSRFIEALPLTALLLTAWSVGEWLGWARSAFCRQACHR